MTITADKLLEEIKQMMLDNFNEEVREIDSEFKRIKKRLNKMPLDI